MDINLFLLGLMFLSGLLTILSPCVFTLLPVIVGGSVNGKNSWRKPLNVASAAGISILVFSLLLKGSTLLINIPQQAWDIISGLIILIFGILTLFPEYWDSFSARSGLNSAAGENLQKASKVGGTLGDFLLGFAIGPVFTSCSVFYFAILGIILPTNYFSGAIYLTIYSSGLTLALFTIGIAGTKLVNKLKWAASPHGQFKRWLAVILVISGWSIMFGLHKDIQTYIVQNVPALNIVANVEQDLLNEIDLSN